LNPLSFENALKIVSELAKDFKASEQYYLNPSYSEADVRNNFINKFFIAHGWDVRHETQENPYEQEVRVENVDQIFTEKTQLQQTKTKSNETYLERKCETLDKQIDELVYQLYGLTEEEIKIFDGKF
jgi:outer membrane protein assembly factor BamA